MSRKRGDRKDGVWLKELDGFHYIMPYLMPSRCDAEVYIEKQLDVTQLMKFLEEKNAPGAPHKTTIFHVFVTAVAKVLCERLLLNRFVAGKRLYLRNKKTMAFVVRRQFTDSAEESLMVMEVYGGTTLEKVSRQILGDADKIRKADGNDINDLLDKLKKLPRWLMRFIMCIFRFLDFHGRMPESICRGDSNYATVLLSNLGSIGSDAAYHHLNDYGTNSIVITIGKLHKAPVEDEEGNVTMRSVINIGVTADERIADGFYFARSIQLLEDILQRPEQLELPIGGEGASGAAEVEGNGEEIKEAIG